MQFVSSSDENKKVLKDSLKTLQEKGAILKSYNIPNDGESFFPNEVPFHANYFKNFLKSSNELGTELFNVYPLLANINGALTPIRTVSKHFNSLEDAYRAYGKIIKYDKTIHDNIIKLIEWDKENSRMISCSLSSFIINRMWETIDAVKNEGSTNINFDTIRML